MQLNKQKPLKLTSLPYFKITKNNIKNINLNVLGNKIILPMS